MYETTATASGGGRDGKTALAGGTMALQLTVPKEPGGPGGDRPNLEKLFALGYSACFLGAMRVASAQTKIKVPDGATVTATIGVGPRSEGGFGITAALNVYLPSRARGAEACGSHSRHLPIFQRHKGQRGRSNHDARTDD
jgi:Ohr subfamily peroxiredoxin